jgi:nucleotide-binding universal stress UspA family protein
MKKLLLFTRNYNTSQGFIEYAMELARDLQFDVQVLYIENPNLHPMAAPDLSGAAVAQLQKSMEEQVTSAKEMLEQQVHDLMHRISGEVIVEVSTAIGNEVNIIGEMVDSGRAHLVMMEGQWIRGFSLKDSFVKDLVRKVNCPVWVIPENSEYKPPEEIIYATDYNEEDIPTLKKLIKLTSKFYPQITALHITKNADFELRIKNAGFQKMIENRTGYDRISAKAFIENNGDDMVEIINSYAARINASLIVVLKENRTFLDRIFSSDPSEKIIEKASRPVLIYHAGNES